MLFGWLFFQGPLLAMATRRSYLCTLGRRLLPAWVAANLGMVGIHILAAPLINWIMNTCIIVPLSPWMVVSIWTVVVAGAVIAMLLLVLYEGWSVRHGFRAWSNLACNIGEVTSPTWSKLWWWILLSFDALAGGILASALIQQAL